MTENELKQMIAEDQQEGEDEEEGDDDEEEESSLTEVKDKVETQIKIVTPPANATQGQMIGRDSNGLFKNHKHFVQMRNKINS
mmetsp:Transcript_1881/g.2606  ORF Transcript_1881/g.2606 Transcript_1881/m.2606 type:complete len:83 (+) Transcript_1881:140-388(+)